MAETPWMGPRKGCRNDKARGCDAGLVNDARTGMTAFSLASCQIIPQQVAVSIEGGVHFDGITLALVIGLWLVIRKKL